MTLRDKKNVRVLNDYMLAISAGRIKKTGPVNKFGRNMSIESADNEDIWDGGGIYVWSSTADITHVVSDDAGDSLLIEVTGLNFLWDEVVQTVTTDGTTSVALETPLIRVNTVRNAGNVDALGNVQVGVGSTTTSFSAANLRAQISIGFGRTLMAIYTIPRNKTGYMTRYWASILRANAASNVNMTGFYRLFGGVFNVGLTESILSAGTSGIERNPKPYPAYPEKTDLKWQADVSANGTDITAGFDLVLEDN